MKRITTIVAALLFMAVQMNGQSVPFLNINADPYSHSMGGATLTLGENAFTAAGSTITEDVPDNALAVARNRETVKENWVNIKKPYKRQHEK